MTDYTDLIKELREWPRVCVEYDGSVDQLHDRAADAIENLSMRLHGDEAAIAGMKREIERMVVAGKPNWIPVAERLPEKRKWVLCKCQANIVEVLRFENAEWYHDPAHVYMFEED